MPSATVSAVDELRTEAPNLGVVVDSRAIERFTIYVDALLLWSSRLSLTGAGDALTIVQDHIVDSLHLASFVDVAARVADIGSGAGFPGLVLAIVCPSAQFALIESRRKRANFLREVARQAGLENVEVVEDRAESHAEKVGRPCDVVTSRAFGGVEPFLRIAGPLLKSGGKAIAMKGPRGRADLESPSADFANAEIVEYRLRSGATHLLLVYRRL